MQFDAIWFLALAPVVFLLGWAASRFDFQQLRMQNRRMPKAYFRGLNHLLQGKRDTAIEDFVAAVRNDPDTPELQFALGHLFRSRGQYTPAVRLHEHLLMRADLTEQERERAQHALALDYTRAGILDRAEAALERLEGTAYQDEAREIRLAIYERLRDWPQAQRVAAQLQSTDAARYTRRQTHYLCEQAKASAQPQAALALLSQAEQIDPTAPRPLLEAAALHSANAQWQQAWAVYQQLLRTHPEWLALVAHAFAAAAKHTGHEAEAIAQLQALYQNYRNGDLVRALVALDAAPADTLYLQHLQHKPSLSTAARWVHLQAEQGAKALPPEVIAALDKAEKPQLRYRCMACGFEGERHYWRCPGCQAWDSYPPARVEDAKTLRRSYYD